jgi:hypothetical protein
VIKRLFFLYQRAMWLVGQARAEAGKPLGLITEFSAILTPALLLGFTITAWQIPVIYGSVLVVAVCAGYVLTRTGVVAYNTQLNNTQNKELLEILKTVKRMERRTRK